MFIYSQFTSSLMNVRFITYPTEYKKIDAWENYFQMEIGQKGSCDEMTTYILCKKEYDIVKHLFFECDEAWKRFLDFVV